MSCLSGSLSSKRIIDSALASFSVLVFRDRFQRYLQVFVQAVRQEEIGIGYLFFIVAPLRYLRQLGIASDSFQWKLEEFMNVWKADCWLCDGVW